MTGNICKIITFFISMSASVMIQEIEAVVGFGAGVPVPGSPNRYEKYVNTCELVYKKHVENKPNVFVAVANNPGICLITRQTNVSNINYQWQIYNYAGIPLGNATKFINRTIAPGDNSSAPTVMVPNFDKPLVAGEDLKSNAPFFKNQNVAGLNYDSREKWLFFLLRNPDSKEERELYRANINGTERKVLFNNKISTDAKE
ncbi:hypothetical protein TSAR_001947 [Trichomalopsis sarcophagae]|uniref:Uncharacterized protein n=1 Tax=Trichomalopsis sarcophagae TaxID=543379 RepID=A0A232FDB5_9HYME|nr:hypothetical protein TSAR_001947 [Trichomalopsis sarcophagae]